MTTKNTSHAAEFDAQCVAINLHIAVICELAEAWTAAPDDEKNISAPAAISGHEDALKSLGLTQADIYNFVNRAAVPEAV